MTRKKRKEFRKAYIDYYPLVLRVLYSKIGSYEDAEDICQEVFIRFYKKFEEIEQRKKWLMSSMRLEINNYYRKKGRTEVKETIDIEENKIVFENGLQDMRIIIKEAIENDENFKNERERTIFELIALNNYTYKQTGRLMGLTTRQVVYKYRIIIRRILNYLKKKGIKNIENLL